MNQDNVKSDLLSTLYAEYYDALVMRCSRYLNYDSDLQYCVEDCVQEAFYLALKKGEEFEKHPYPLKWLVITCKHQMDNRIKRKRIKDKHTAALSSDAFIENIEDKTGRMENWLEREEANACIKEIYALLTKSELTVYTDYFEASLSTAKIAEKHNKPETAIKATIRRIRKKARLLQMNKYFIFLISLVSFFKK